MESRERVGDREADTIIGKGHSGAVVSLVDRAPEYTYSRRAGRRTSAAVSAAMPAMPRPSDTPVHTITADNGREFADHAGVAEALKAGFFLPTPQHSRERGQTGHTTGWRGGTCRRGRTCGRSATMRWDGCRTARARDRAGCPATGRPTGCSARPALPDTAGPPASRRRGWPRRKGVDRIPPSRPSGLRSDATRPGGGPAPSGKRR